MNFNDAKAQIEKIYKCQQVGNDILEINVQKLLNPFNFMFICLFNDGDKLMLSDMAETADIFYDKTEAYFIEKGLKYNVNFNEWHYEKEYHSFADLDAFIKLLTEISEEVSDEA